MDASDIPSRREFLRTAAVTVAGLAAGCGTEQAGAPTPDAPPVPDLPSPDPDTIAESTAFPIGIASGDVEATRAIVWTRYAGGAVLRLVVWVGKTGPYGPPVVDVVVTPGEAGFVHLDVTTLQGGTHYRYAFVEEASGRFTGRSAVGRFRTALPAGALAPITFGASSCTQRKHTAPAPLGHAAQRGDLDLFLFLGDTSYNDAAETLDEYRESWALTLGGSEYRALRASTSVLATIDDHEVKNDFNPETIDPDRLAAAMQSMFEALPLRRDPANPERLWKRLRWGDTAEFFVVDGRTERKPSTRLTGLLTEQIYLSRAQMDWLKAGLRDSTARFKVILNSVPITDFGFSIFNTDGWLAYGRQRAELLGWIDDQAIPGVLWISGDHHFASVGRISASGAGATSLEALAGPGGQKRTEVAALLGQLRWDFAAGEYNYLAVTLQPETGEARLVYHDASGAVLHDASYALA